MGGSGTEPAREYTFFYGKGNENHKLGIYIKFPKYPMKILLGDIIAKVGREEIFKWTIGSESYSKLVMIMELG
jgi:hypothetical protein